MTRLRGWIWMVLLTAYLATACRPEEPHQCEEYCDEMVTCAETLGQLESRSACERDCFDWLERYETVGCDDQFISLKECQIDMSCTSSQDVGDICASEIQRLNSCIQ